MNEIQSLLTLLAIWGALWAANTLLAVRNNIKAGDQWSWRKFFDGAIKAGLAVVALTIGAVAIHFIPEVFAATGFVVDEATKKAISMLGLLGSVGSGVIIYAKKFISSVGKLFNPENEVKVDVRPNADNWNKGTVGLETMTGDKTDKELLENE